MLCCYGFFIYHLIQLDLVAHIYFFLFFYFFPQASTNSGANERASRCDGRMRNNREKAKARQTRVVTVQQQQKQCKQMFAECNNRCQNVFKV